MAYELYEWSHGGEGSDGGAILIMLIISYFALKVVVEWLRYAGDAKARYWPQKLQLSRRELAIKESVWTQQLAWLERQGLSEAEFASYRRVFFAPCVPPARPTELLRPPSDVPVFSAGGLPVLIVSLLWLWGTAAYIFAG